VTSKTSINVDNWVNWLGRRSLTRGSWDEGAVIGHLDLGAIL